MLKSYEEMRAVDVTPYCEKLDGYLYLNWARCIDLLHEHGAEIAYFVPVQNPKTGGSLYESETVFADKNGNTNRNYEVRILIHIDYAVYTMQGPVLNGKNPVKDNSMNQLRVWTAMCRLFVKGVAIYTGLGFNLWLNEEERTLEQIPEAKELAPEPMIITIKKTCEKHKVNLNNWLKKNGVTLKTLTADQAALMIRALNEKFPEEEQNSGSEK